MTYPHDLENNETAENARANFFFAMNEFREMIYLKGVSSEWALRKIDETIDAATVADWPRLASLADEAMRVRGNVDHAFA